MDATRLTPDFYLRDVLLVAPELVGKRICRIYEDGTSSSHIVTEVEAYKGMNDLACHASKRRTPRNDAMFQQGGILYIYFVYGMHWMLNVVASVENEPEAVLIRGVAGCSGPGRVSRLLKIDRSFYAENLGSSQRIWIEDSGLFPSILTAPRIGVNYAGSYWSSRPWRFYTNDYR
jgi:DNA-3-methyladenine glycosylase